MVLRLSSSSASCQLRLRAGLLHSARDTSRMNFSSSDTQRSQAPDQIRVLHAFKLDFDIVQGGRRRHPGQSQSRTVLLKEIKCLEKKKNNIQSAALQQVYPQEQTRHITQSN